MGMDIERILERLDRLESKIDKQNFVSFEKGIIKKSDALGRITLPIQIRRMLDIDESTELEITVIGDKIVIKKAEQ